MKYLCAVDRLWLDCPGGSYRVAWVLANALHDRGHSVTVLCSALEGEGAEGPTEVEGIRVVRFRIPQCHKGDPRRMHLRISAAEKAAMNWLGSESWDVIHGHTLTTAIGAFKAATSSTRTVFSVHSPAISEQMINWNNGTIIGTVKQLFGRQVLMRAEARLYRHVGQLHTLSEFTTNEVGRLFGTAMREKCTRIPFWSPIQPRLQVERTAARTKLGLSPKTVLGFCLRRLVSRMGIDLLLESLTQMRNRENFRVVIAGDGPLRKTLEQRAEAAGLADCVVFAGRLTDSEVAVYYSAADFFVLPTAELECFGLIILEALQHGCPVIAFDVGAVGEILRPILPDCLVQRGNTKQLALILQRAVDAPFALPRGEALSSFVRKHYDMSSLVEKYEGLLFSGSQLVAPEKLP